MAEIFNIDPKLAHKIWDSIKKQIEGTSFENAFPTASGFFHFLNKELINEEKGSIKLKKGTSDQEIKKFIDKGMNVELNEDHITNPEEQKQWIIDNLKKAGAPKEKLHKINQLSASEITALYNKLENIIYSKKINEEIDGVLTELIFDPKDKGKVEDYISNMARELSFSYIIKQKTVKVPPQHAYEIVKGLQQYGVNIKPSWIKEQINEETNIDKLKLVLEEYKRIQKEIKTLLEQYKETFDKNIKEVIGRKKKILLELKAQKEQLENEI